MKRIHLIAVVSLVLVTIVLFSWYVFHGDIFFTSDIARDFWLIREVSEKKLMLIGPRSSGDLYHGPLWSYLNWPAYAIGGGDPVVVGWYWVLLAFLVTIVSYFVGKSLFNRTVGVAYALMVSLYLSFHTRALANPHGAMFFLPLWFFLFVRYLQKKNIVYLAGHIFLSGIITQFQLAVGIPFSILSAVALIPSIIKTKQYRHLAAFLLLPLSLSNFVVFDLRHNHLLWNKVIAFITPHTDQGIFNYFFYISDRVFLLFTNTEILRRDPGMRNIALFISMLILVGIQIRDKKYVTFYLSFLYFYAGFFILSFIDKGPILYYHLYPLFLWVFLVFCSLFTSRYKTAFLVLFAVIYTFNLSNSVADARDSTGFIGQNKASWKSLSDIARAVYEDAPEEFGYFVYAPDVMAYEPKYAMSFIGKQYPTKTGYSFTKLPVTYLVIQPPPHGNPYMKDEWWRVNQVEITKEPEDTVTFANGYKIEKYFLTGEEQSVPFDPAIDPGLHFR